MLTSDKSASSEDGADRRKAQGDEESGEEEDEMEGKVGWIWCGGGGGGEKGRVQLGGCRMREGGRDVMENM